MIIFVCIFFILRYIDLALFNGAVSTKIHTVSIWTSKNLAMLTYGTLTYQTDKHVE